MPLTYSKYRVQDQDSGAYLSDTIPNIIDVVELTGVSTTSGSNEVTVADTTEVYPGMALFIPTLPQGAFVHAVKSSTVITAWAPVFASATGTWTVSAASANATATASSMKGMARGFNEWGIPVPLHDGSTYRNELNQTGAGFDGHGTYTGGGGATGKSADPVSGQAGVLVVPSNMSVLAIGPSGGETGVVVGSTAFSVATSDTIAGTPPRPWPKWVLEYVLVAHGGAVTRIRKAPHIQVVRTGSSTSAGA
jgi:hypothetical protein